MNPLKDKYDIGVVVGRFQVPELSKGHHYLLTNVGAAHRQMIVMIGVSPTLGTKQNPLGYTARMKMIQEAYPNAIISHIMDVKCDKIWSKTLDLTIRALCPLGSVCLYGGRDSFIKHYTGIFPIFELAEISDQTAGTQIREIVGKELPNTTDFRKGIIWSCQNQYPKVYPTVDIAVIKTEGKKKSVLLARRTKDSLLQFPGGFVEPSDITMESAAQRELSEELDVEADNFKIIGSHRINDWRYKGSERIMTTLVRCDYIFGSGRPVVDVDDVFHNSEWLDLKSTAIDSIENGHKPLFERLLISEKENKSV